MQIYANNPHEQNQNKSHGLELWITSFLFGKPIKMKMLHVENVENYVDFSYSLSRKTNA
jgi:hypothetical protein